MQHIPSCPPHSHWGAQLTIPGQMDRTKLESRVMLTTDVPLLMEPFQGPHLSGTKAVRGLRLVATQFLEQGGPGCQILGLVTTMSIQQRMLSTTSAKSSLSISPMTLASW